MRGGNEKNLAEAAYKARAHKPQGAPEVREMASETEKGREGRRERERESMVNN